MKKFLLAIILLIPSLLFGQSNDSVKYAISLLNGSSCELNYIKGISMLKEYAIKGNVEAINALGIAHLKGLGVEVNEDVAVSYLRESAQGGYGNSWVNLGRIFANNKSKYYDERCAVDCYNQAIQLGSEAAYYPAACAAYYGTGRNVDYDFAVQYFKKCAGMRMPEGMYMLGLCYMNGQGVQRDYSLAKEWLENARLHGINKAKEVLDELINIKPEQTDVQNLKVNGLTSNGKIKLSFELAKEARCVVSITSSLYPDSNYSEDMGICSQGVNIIDVPKPQKNGVFIISVYCNNNLSSISFIL